MLEVSLAGCAPEPLMSYLKALGVFRLVAEQVDPDSRLSWKGGIAQLDSTLERDGLLKFFLEEYRPTPIVGPWGARSGFYRGSSESSAREALNAIVLASKSAPRLAQFCDVIESVRELLTRHGFTEKVKDDDKLTLMRICRNELPDAVVSWLDSVYVLTDESRKFPPLLGTGGNEGSGSYVSTFAQVVETLLIRRENDDALAPALFGDFASKLGGLAVGHFNPGAVGGPNSSQGFGGGGGANSWDYLFAIEGAILFAGAVARRMGTNAASRAAFPFCVEAVAVGYATGSDKEASEATRAELWLPLWSSPACLGELTSLFAEGRAQLNRRQVRNAVEFALALASLGVNRGINSFVRYGFVMRNGLSYFAAPLGRVAVTPRPSVRLLHDPPFSEWLEKLRIACSDKEGTPSRYQTALRQIDRAIFQFANRSEQGNDADAKYLIEVLRALGRAEQTLSQRLRFSQDKFLKPLSSLNLGWLLLAKPTDEWREFRLAASLASVLGEPKNELGPLRTHLEHVEMGHGWPKWAPGSSSAVWNNSSINDNLAAVLIRRWLEAEQSALTGVPLRAKVFASLADVVAFLTPGGVDDVILTELLFGLIGMNWANAKWFEENRDKLRSAFASPNPDVTPTEFAAIRLIVQPLRLIAHDGNWRVARPDESNQIRITPDKQTLSRLIRGSGRDSALAEAVELAGRRLHADQLANVFGPPRRLRPSLKLDPLRLAAACLFPLSRATLNKLIQTIVEYRSVPT